MTKFFLSCILLMLLSLGSSAHLQRLSIVPQKIRISKYAPGNAKSICIDYYREAPNSYNIKDQPAYDQVYSSEDVAVKINGEPSNRSFQSLVQSDNPLLLLQPNSHESVKVLINENNPESANIKSIELEVKKPAEIGNNKEDRNVRQAKLIFENWGTDITQDNFWKRAKHLDILEKNNKLILTADGKLTSSSVASCDKLINTLDLNIFSEKTIKTLIENNFFALDNALNLTDESSQKLQQVYSYEQAIRKVKELNIYSADVKKLKEQLKERYQYSLPGPELDSKITDNLIHEVVVKDFKDKYYKSCESLTKIDRENKLIRDTIIGGARYVLMIAWKSTGFTSHVKNGENLLPYYTSDKEFFKYPLFLTTKYDIEKWAIDNKISLLPEDHYNSRLMEGLGLPPNSSNETFYEFWVKEEDVFRPTVDSTLKCSLLLIKPAFEYLNTLANFSKNSYSNESILYQYTFTGYGRTYDSNPGNINHDGVTEFVLKENRTVYIRRTVPTKEYIKSISKNKEHE